jgi:hypothetical protein
MKKEKARKIIYSLRVEVSSYNYRTSFNYFLNGQKYCLSPVDYLNMIEAGKKVKNKRLGLRKVL